ncbi:triosephosphate isomerase [Mycobacterium tuberculosis CAS/NITR204]|uniref:Triosephosphate isomerase n=12 Tax=Mycobacterium tuberculosis TaxID=1773 RepID=R4M803_MYCTX|nr:triosephosphate isomerase [Mycobacterium tuberculosis CAS/NITR204]
MSRKPLIAGNWKMNLNHYEAIALVQKIAFSLPDKYYDRVDVAVIPPFTDLRSVQTLVDGDKLRLTYGAQDLSPHDSGAYTGDVSGAFLAKLGCSYVVVGHSERRTYHNEDDALVAAKAATALKHGLTPIVCIGEHLDVREAGNHVAHNIEQLRGSLAGLLAEQIGSVVIAYEPVWAIGTGRVASAADAQEVCAAIRKELASLAFVTMPIRCGCSTAARGTPKTSATSWPRMTSMVAWSAGRRWTGSISRRWPRLRPVVRCRSGSRACYTRRPSSRAINARSTSTLVRSLSVASAICSADSVSAASSRCESGGNGTR